MRKIISITLINIILVFALFLTACGDKSEEKSSSLKVGITMYDEFDPFTNTIADEIINRITEIGESNGVNATCDLVYAGKSQLLQNDQVQDFIRKKYDVICINLVDRTDAMSIIDMAKNADVPIVFFNRELVEEDLRRWDKLYYVGANSEESGRMQAQIVIDALSTIEGRNKYDFSQDGIIQYVMLEGEAGHQDALMRTKVSVEEIKRAGFEMDKLGDEIANWNREQASTKMTSILAGYPWQVELVIANDDNIALGALDALENKGVPKTPLIVGVNGELEVLEEIKKGNIVGTVYNNAYKQGEKIAKMAYSLGRGEKFPDDITVLSNKYVFIPYEIINKDNVDEYMEKATY